MNVPIRVVAVLAALGLVVISLKLAFDAATLGFAIGGWTGLKDHQQALLDAERESDRLMLQLVLAQLLGGACAFIGLRPSRPHPRWSPLFVAAFPVATFLIAVTVMAVCRNG